MSDMQNSELLKKIITKIQNKNDNEKASSNINVKPAIVTGVMEDTGKISAYFIDDGNKTEYTFFNKSGEILEEGNEIKIYYTSNPAKGWVGMRCGDLNVEEKTITNINYNYSNPITEYEYLSNNAVLYNGITYQVEKDNDTGLISKITDSYNNHFEPIIHSGITNTSLHNAVFWAVAMHSGLKPVTQTPYVLKSNYDKTNVVYGTCAKELKLQPNYNDVGFYKSGIETAGFATSSTEGTIPCIGLHESHSINAIEDNYIDSIVAYIDGFDYTDWNSMTIEYGITNDDSANTLTVRGYFKFGVADKVKSHVEYNWEDWTLLGENTKYTTNKIIGTKTFDISKIKGVQRLNFGVYHGTETWNMTGGLVISKILLSKNTVNSDAADEGV